MGTAVMPLPAAVRSLLQSSCHVNCFRRAVEELVYNSLDSKATSIAVRINYSDFSLQVVDNGFGISRPDMAVIGTMFMTSKCMGVQDINTVTSQYGISGRALASVIDISEYVGITSRHRNNDETLLKVFHNGKAEEVFETVRRPSKGTTVEIKGLLYNLKIQRKNLDAIMELQEIKKFLEHMAIFHKGVSFSLRDDVKNDIILKLPKSKDIVKTVELIYALNISEKWQELQIEKNPYKVKAYLGMHCRDDDSIQLIYLNGRHLVHSKLHAIVNSNLHKIFTSDMSKHARVKKDIEIKRISNPFYILCISCPCNEYDMTEINKKTLIQFHNWSPVTGLLKTLVKIFSESLQPKTEVNTTNMQKTAMGANTHNIQEKVEAIIQKVLNSDPKKLQIQNGMKGKPAKRYNKSHGTKMDKVGSISKRNKTYSTINKLVLESVKPFLKSAEKNKVWSSHPQEKTKNDIPEMNKIKRAAKKSELRLLKNCHKKSENCKEKNNCKVPAQANHIYLRQKQVTEIFKAVEGSVKERCRNISRNAIYLMRKYNKLKQSQKRQVTVSATSKTTNIYKAKSIKSIQKRSDKVVIREFIPFPKNCNRKEFLKKLYYKYLREQASNPIKSRYDLVQTIIKTQHSENANESSLRKINETVKNKNKKNYGTGKKIQSVNEIPFLTYESHRYDKNMVGKKCYLYANTTRRESPKQNLTNNYTKSKLNLSESSDYVISSIKSTEKNINVITASTKQPKTDSISNAKIPGIQTCFKQPSSEGNKSKTFKLVIQKNNELTYYVEEFVSLTEIINKDKEYDFDDDVNEPIQLSLSCQGKTCKLQNHNHITFFDHVTTRASIISTRENSKSIKLPEINSTYIVEQPFVQKPIDNKNIIDNLQTNNITTTSNNFSVNKINHTNHLISKENRHENNQYVVNTSVSNDLTEYTNDFTKIDNGFEKEIKTGLNTIEVIFESRSYPPVETSESKQNFNNDGIVDPLSLCQAVMESSDMFETRSLDFESPGVYNKENNNYKKTCDHSKVLNEQEIEKILPNGQVHQQCNEYADDMLSNQLCQVFDRTYVENGNNSVDGNENNHISQYLESPILRNKIVKLNKPSASKNFKHNEGLIIPDKKGVNLFKSTDTTGKLYYLDVKTGMTLKNDVIDRREISDFNVKRRHGFIPKGFSPIFVSKVQTTSTELPSQEYFTKSLYENFVKDVEKCSEAYEANVQNLVQNTDLDKAQSRFRKLTASIVFDGKAIATAKVLGQVDCKFIACLMQGRQGKYLALVDQHAADERVRLETLLDEYKTGSIWNSGFNQEFKMTVTEEEFFYLENFKNSFQKLGLEWTTDPHKENGICIVGVPLAILGKKLRTKEVIVGAATAMIRENVKTLKCMKEAANAPQCLMDLVNMEACRSAVRFGVALNRAECARLVSALARCSAPFQCAHGRPTVTLLLAVTPLRRDYEIDMGKLKKFKSK